MMATEKRLIDANRYGMHIADIQLTNRGWRDDICEFLDYMTELLDEQPTVDAVEVVHGRWVSDEGDVLFHCSECDTQISTSWDYDDLLWNYCPNCGANMRSNEE